MLRISWPLALLLLGVTIVVARKPRMLPVVLIVFATWFVIEQMRDRGRPR